MDEFDPSSDACNRERKRLRQVRGMESVMEEFDPSSRLGIGNGELESNYNSWNREWRRSSKCLKFGIGNRELRDKFRNLES